MKKNEQGRSMIEMLAVLGIIGVLSIGGYAGYKLAIQRIFYQKVLKRFLLRLRTIMILKLQLIFYLQMRLLKHIIKLLTVLGVLRNSKLKC